MPYKTNARQILTAISGANHILLISHEKPDGDTLGASLAMSKFLEKEKIVHKHFCADKHAPYFDYLPKIENVINDYKEINLADHDLIITLDCGDIRRTTIHEDLNLFNDKTIIINIDHHESNDLFGHHNLVVTNASSTSEIMYKFFEFHQIKIDKYMATSLLTGIITDTMNFSNAATNNDSLKIAATLLKRGARVNKIISQVSGNKNLNSLKLWGTVLARLQLNEQYNFAYTVITQKDLQENKISAEEARDGLANFLSMLNDVNFILVLTEEENEIIKGSLRTTKDNVDVAKMANAFGGGGHKKAAGFTTKGKLIETTTGWQVE